MSTDSGVEILFDRLSEMKCAQCGTQMDISALEPFSSVECPSCGNQDTVPARFGEFLLLNLINTGGMGGVYRAKDQSLGRLVAIKVMLRTLGEDLEFVENFKREAQAAARLNHPNVAQIYSYGQVNGQPYIVMELVSGHRFDRLIEGHAEGLDPAMVLRIGIDIAEGLKAADEIGLIHGDIKPENILLDEKRKGKLVDFGIASFADQAASAGIWGTPYYIAPEKALGRKSDARSDIYSLGGTLYHALAGQPPFDGETPIDVVKARLDEPPRPLEEIRAELPKSVTDTIARMLQREPGQRHPTYASLLGDLRRALQDVNAAGLSPRATTSGRRVIIKRKDLGATPSGRLAARAGGMAAAMKGLPNLEEAKAAQRVRRRKVLKVVGLVVLGLALVSAVTSGLVVRHRHAEAALAAKHHAYQLDQAKRRAERLQATLAPVAARIDGLVAKLGPPVVAVQKLQHEVEGLERDFPPPAGGGAVALPPVVAADTNAPAVAPMPTTDSGRIAQLAKRVEDLAASARQDGERVPAIVKASNLLKAGLATASNELDVVVKENELQTEKTELDDIEKRLKKLPPEAGELVGKAESIAQEARKQAAQRRQGEEARKTEEARLALIAKERAAVAELASRGRESLSRMHYKDALKLIGPVERTLTTDEGRQAIKVVSDRFERLAGLKKFVVEQLQKTPYPWGWVRSPTAREDVLGADENGVKLKGRNVPWEKVSSSQYLMFVERTVMSPQVRRSVQGEFLLAAALYCAENGNAELANRYRDRAIDALPSMQAEAQRLLVGSERPATP